MALDDPQAVHSTLPTVEVDGMSYPLLSRREWLSLLDQVGLEQPAALPAPDSAAVGLEHQHVLVARSGRHTNTDSLAPQLRNLLIFADAGGLGERLAELVEAQGGQAMLVASGPRFAQVGPRRFQVAPDDPDAIAQLVRYPF